MRAPIVLAANLAVGLGLLGWCLVRFGAPALEVLQPSPWLAGFLAGAALTTSALAWRWRYVLAGLGPPLGLPVLAIFRSAAHGVAVLIPSGKLGGDPLRAWLVARAGVAPANAVASVAADRTLEMGATAPFSVLFATLLVQHGVPELGQALATVAIGTLGLLLGVGFAVGRLRRGAGLVTSLVGQTRLDRLRIVGGRRDLMVASEAAAARLVAQPRRMLWAFLAGIAANLLVVLEFGLLLAAFGLPTSPIAVVAALFATGAAHLLPVPAGLGVLEGSQIWIFGMLGYPAHVGLAVGLVARLRDLVWMLPGLLYLLGRALAGWLPRRSQAP